jgi:hypothetical protein
MQTWLQNLQTILRKVSMVSWAIIGGVTALVLSIIIAVAVTAGHKTPVAQHNACTGPTASACGVASKPKAVAYDPSHGKCTGKGTVPMTVSPIATDQIGVVEPMGQMIGGHVTPIDHGYIFGKDGHNATPNQYEVRAPADGIITEMSATDRSGNEQFTDHAITISFTCTVAMHFLNMDSFSDALVHQTGEISPKKSWTGAIKVKAGDVIGHTGTHGIDIYMWNQNSTLKGFVKPDQYVKAEGWKLHTVDPYMYFVEPVKSQLLAKNPRTAEPRGGKIDYDVDTHLIGTWFRQDSGGYASTVKPGEGVNTWAGHLSFAPDAFDPNGFMVSIGDWQGSARQFGLILGGTQPHPKDVNYGSGIVKYELHPYHWTVASTGKSWDNISYQGPVTFTPESKVEGVLLVQLSADGETLKIEEIPGKTAKQVTGFGSNTMIYER